jgi:hypothetical protein
MVQNTLKQQARSFMERHSVSYSTALRAVDEPLHELRSLLRNPRAREFSFAQGFRLIPEDSIYGEAYFSKEPLSPSGRRHDDRFSYRNSLKYMEESVRRYQLLRDHKVLDIWYYRELRRAGLTAPDAPEIEPVFHHYMGELGSSFSPIAVHGGMLGIFGVNMDQFAFISEHFPLIPVTDQQLKSLAEGSPAGPVEGFRYSLAERDDAERWTDSYRSMAVSTRKDSHNRPSVTVFSKKPSGELIDDLERRGIPSWRCAVEDLADDGVEVELNFELWGTSLRVGQGSKRIVRGGTDKILLWD